MLPCVRLQLNASKPESMLACVAMGSQDVILNNSRGTCFPSNHNIVAALPVPVKGVADDAVKQLKISRETNPLYTTYYLNWVLYA